MTKEEASKLTTDVSSSVVLRTKIPRIVPPTMVAKLKFNVNVAINAPSGAVQAYLFRANDGYDPDYTGTGTQPKGLDQYFAFYRKAVCKGSKITIKSINGASTFDALAQWGFLYELQRLPKWLHEVMLKTLKRLGDVGEFQHVESGVYSRVQSVCCWRQRRLEG